MPLASSWSRSSGAPISVRGSGRSAPRVQTRDVAPVGWVTGSPVAAASSTPSGRRLIIASAPTSTAIPATSPRRSLPPSRSDPSRTSTSWPASARSRAAVNPLIPPPTTMHRTGISVSDPWSVVPGACLSARGHTRRPGMMGRMSTPNERLAVLIDADNTSPKYAGRAARGAGEVRHAYGQAGVRRLHLAAAQRLDERAQPARDPCRCSRSPSRPARTPPTRR